MPALPSDSAKVEDEQVMICGRAVTTLDWIVQFPVCFEPEMRACVLAAARLGSGFALARLRAGLGAAVPWRMGGPAPPGPSDVCP